MRFRWAAVDYGCHGCAPGAGLRECERTRILRVGVADEYAVEHDALPILDLVICVRQAVEQRDVVLRCKDRQHDKAVSDCYPSGPLFVDVVSQFADFGHEFDDLRFRCGA